MCIAFCSLLLVVHAGPKGEADGVSGPCHAGLPEALGTLEAPLAPRLVATAFRARCNAGICLAVSSSRVTIALCAAGHEEPGSEDRPGAWQGGKQRASRVRMGVACDGFVAVLHGLPEPPELGDQGADQEGVR